MANPDKKIVEFPDAERKLQAPTKQSVFERQKQEAEAKRLREEAETAAVYESFVKSFDDEDDMPGSFGGSSMPGAPRRHFGGSSSGLGGRGGRVNSGPGSLGSMPASGGYGGGRGGSGPGSLGPPPNSLGWKKAHEGFEGGHSSKRREDDRPRFDNYGDIRQQPKRAFNTSDDEEEREPGRTADPPVPKPTLRLASLPPGSSPAVIKALIPPNLTVDAVRIIPPTGPVVAGERKSTSAIVTLSEETAANDIDAAVGTLQNKYLGYGFYLTLHRHLSSAALSSAQTTSGSTGNSSQPFGAKPVNLDQGPASSHAPPGQRGFAPPTSYAPSGPGPLSRNQPLLHVPVQAPKDIKELKIIHRTVESMLTHGPEFEALLMSRPEVQREEKWAWLWDSRSTGGVWYRWRLWEVLTGTQTRRGQGRYLPLFEDSSAWKQPDAPLPYEYNTRLDEFVSDSEYNSSDENESGDEGGRPPMHRSGGPPDTSNLNTDDGTTYLNPLEKAKLTHLLARLPTSTGKLRKGDVARVTAFAISHAGRGADEVVSAIISNIEKPFTYTSANPDRKNAQKNESADQTPAADAEAEDEKDEDTSSSKLIGLYLISDILSSSSTSGVRHAWRYRQLFEAALKSRKTFENLGRLEKRMAWGKLRAEKWKRSVGNVLGLWEGWCVFPQDAQDHFVKVFNDPPLTKSELAEKQEEAVKTERMSASRWKSVEVGSATPGSLPVSTKEDYGDVDAMAVDDGDDVDGEPMDEDEDVDGVPMDDSDDGDGDGEPMEEDINDSAATPDVQGHEISPEEPVKAAPSPTRLPRRRPRAVDMFADSGSEGD